MKLNFDICLMPFWTFFNKTTVNYNVIDIFDDYQIGYISIIIYKSKETRELWYK
jgi:hypothetical protein